MSTPRKPLTGPNDPRHGTRNGYSNLGCRCDACGEAERLHDRTRKRESPEAKEVRRLRDALRQGTPEFKASRQAPEVKERTRVRVYGIPVDRLRAVIGDGACHICGNPGAHVDHDHDRGDVRGYLCRGCNHGIGNLRDDPSLLLAAANYLHAYTYPPLAPFTFGDPAPA